MLPHPTHRALRCPVACRSIVRTTGQGIHLPLVVLAAATVGGTLLALAGWKSIEHYQPPPPLQAHLPGGDALSRRVVLIVLDGIRADVVPRMDFLKSLAAHGSSGITKAVQPSLSLPARASMVTGARPAIHGVTTNGRIFKTVGDSVFSLAKRAGLPAAAAGWRFWSDSLGDTLGENVYIYRDKPSDDAPLNDFFVWQQYKCRRAVEFLSQWDRGVLVVAVVTPDIIGHQYGGESPQYLEAAEDADRCIQRVVKSLNDGDTTFIVASDHGHIDQLGSGGHGGTETEVTDVPTVLYGRAVKRGSGWRGEQIDIAPTICALLGLPLPASNQGEILWDAIDVPPDARDELRRRETQQLAFARARLPDEAAGRIQERKDRIPAALLAAALGAGTIIWAGFRLREMWHAAAFGVVVYYAAYRLLFWVTGLNYSLSSVGGEDSAWYFMSRNLAAGSLALWCANCVVAWISRLSFRRWLPDLANLIGATLGVQAATIHLQHGLFMVYLVPDLDHVIKAYLDLTQLSAIGATVMLLILLDSARAGFDPLTARRQPTDLCPSAAELLSDRSRPVAE